MRSPIYVHYGLNATGILIISCYHDKGPAYMNYKGTTIRYKDTKNLENKFPDFKEPEQIPIAPNDDLEVVERNLKVAITGKLAEIVNKFGVKAVSEVIFLADINLCVNNYNIAKFLLDDTLTKLLFQGGISLVRTLESGTSEIVQRGIEIYKNLSANIEFKSALSFQVKGRKVPIEYIEADETVKGKILAKRKEVERLIQDKGVSAVILIPEPELADPDPGDDMASEIEQGDKIKESGVPAVNVEPNVSVSSETQRQVNILKVIISTPKDVIANVTSQLEEMEVTETKEKNKTLTQ
ncbi:hypothetical protein ACQUW5_12280 [Legionella sp. CNM-1927-20]|uniref:hypothetical protein n=1 Tax=Legionella sp. CNM-1927-20 TaxID=3422221 RepID=UPI00403A923F